MYRARNKGMYVVARNFFLLLLNCSSGPAWLLLNKICIPLFRALYIYDSPGNLLRSRAQGVFQETSFRQKCSSNIFFLQSNPESMQYVLAVLSFFTVVFGGLAVGILVGMASALILKSTKDVRHVRRL